MKETSKKTANVVEEEEEESELYYEMTIENLTINVYEGGKVIFQSGKAPVNPPPGGGG